MKKMTQHDSLGNISILVLIVGLVMSMSIGGLVTFAATQYTASRRSVSLQEAVMIAESGVQYYRWHLAHNPDDYWDGNPPEEGRVHLDHMFMPLLILKAIFKATIA